MTQSSPPIISPPLWIPRPLVSFYVITYNQEQFIGKAVSAALQQTYQPLQVIISDDCSTDATYSIITELVASYQGPHDVQIRRNDRNLGVGAHINAIVNCCRGDIIVASAGDDSSSHDRVDRLIDWWRNNAPGASLIFSNLVHIDETRGTVHEEDIASLNPSVARHSNGVAWWSVEDHLEGRSLPVHGASIAYWRYLFEYFGPLRPGIVFEDNVLDWRAEALGGVGFCPAHLVYHRIHPQQITEKYSRSALFNAVRRRRMLHWSCIQSIGQTLDDLQFLAHHGVLDAALHRRAQTGLQTELRANIREYRVEFWPWPVRSVLLLLYGWGSGTVGQKIRRLFRALVPSFLYTAAMATIALRRRSSRPQ